MKRTGVALLWIALAWPAGALAAGCGAHGVVDFWSDENLRVAGVDLAAVTCPSDYTMVRAGLSYYGDGEFIFEGATASGRLVFGKGAYAYVGAGALVGFSTENEGADSDQVDNDGDGLVDELDEGGLLASWFGFPEAGVGLQLGDFGLSLSARRFYGEKFNGEFIYSFGISVPFDDY